jgi:hypothetical protein
MDLDQCDTMRNDLRRLSSVVRMHALAVIGKDFDDPALIHTAVAAAFDHDLQLGFQGHETADALFDLDEPRFGDRIG